MTADFFRKNVYKWIVGVITVCFTLICFVYAWFLSRAKEVEIMTGFFYLVREETNVEVGIEFVKLEGGAGYLLRQNGQDYVVLSVYLNEKDGIAVQTNLSGDKETQLVYVGVDTLYFKTQREKENAAVYTGALQIFYSCMEMFDGVIQRLEDGATQERTKGILLTLSRQLDYLSQEYAQVYPAFSAVCRRCSQRIEEYCADILFAGDLRYELCIMTEEYLTLAGAFAI